MSGNTPDACADGERGSVEFGHDREHRFIRDIVADEQRTAVAERRTLHQFPNAARLADVGMLDLEDAFARQHLDRRIRQIRLDQRNRFANRGFGIWRGAACSSPAVPA